MSDSIQPWYEPVNPPQKPKIPEDFGQDSLLVNKNGIKKPAAAETKYVLTNSGVF